MLAFIRKLTQASTTANRFPRKKKKTQGTIDSLTTRRATTTGIHELTSPLTTSAAKLQAASRLLSIYAFRNRAGSVQPYLMDQVIHASQFPTQDLTDLSTLRSWINFPRGQSMEHEIYKATNAIQGYGKVGSLKPEKAIPDAILRQAKGLAIITVVKVGMTVTYNIGTGLVVARREDGSWSPPSAISSCGIGWGAQISLFVIVLRTTEAVKTFGGTAHFSVGASLSAAVGPIGRAAEADVRAGDGGCAACYTYSCSKGAFVGCSLQGSVVTTRTRENCRFYDSQSINTLDILLGSLPRPPAAAILYNALADIPLYQRCGG
ncbi:hypothetical protein EUGRSUZ_L00277 [Eucalyptus grandis]|uniref:Uncharacterized protein n=2 Tax=Eucalyptus grandis TaxID=71139 RepID=A0ACC3LCK1_EUCGR|nr:hypothetical protein EUGRSUZ_L00277 [Eucalyptus grandis]